MSNKTQNSPKLSPFFAALLLSACLMQSGGAEPLSVESRNQAILLARDGKALYDGGQYQSAISKFEEALKIGDPEDPFTRLYLSMSLFQSGKTKEAVECLEKSKSPASDDSVAWYNQGVTFGMFGSFDKALEKLNYFVDHFPSDSRISEVKGLIVAFQKGKASQDKQGPTADINDYFQAAVRDGATRWADDAIPVKVFLSSGKRLPGFVPEFENAVKEAFSDWTRASGGRITFEYVSSPKNCQIDVQWTDDPAVLKNAAEAGHCQVSGNEKGSSRADVTLLIKNRTNGAIVSVPKMKYTARHEIGHALGIAGHSTNVRDIMFLGTVNDNVPDQISDRDANTIKRIYATSPDALFSSDENAWVACTNKGVEEINGGRPAAAIPLLEKGIELAPAEKKTYVKGVLGLAHLNNALKCIRSRLLDDAKTNLDTAVELLTLAQDKKNLAKCKQAYKLLEDTSLPSSQGPPAFQLSH